MIEGSTDFNLLNAQDGEGAYVTCDCMQAAVQEFASATAVKEYVGKRGGQKSMGQADIDALLVRYCLQVSCMRISASVTHS